MVVPTPSARLEVVAGIETKSFALAKAKYQVGRAAGSDIQLPEDSVSSRHAQLERAGGGWKLTDLQSTNGTFVNDQRIDSVELKPGDRVRFGEVRVRFAQDAPEQALRSGTAVMPSRSDTTFVAATRRIPAWGYGVAAFVVVALGVGIFLLRDTLPPTPTPDPVDGPLQAKRLWTVEVAGGGVIGTPALGKINDDDFLDVVIPERGGFVTAVDGEEGKIIYRQQVPEKIMASVTVGRVTGEGPSDAVVATTGGIVYTLGEDGQSLWTSDSKLDLGPIVNKPLLADIDRDRLEDVIVPTARKGLVALDGDRGLEALGHGGNDQWSSRRVPGGRRYQRRRRRRHRSGHEPGPGARDLHHRRRCLETVVGAIAEQNTVRLAGRGRCRRSETGGCGGQGDRCAGWQFRSGCLADAGWTELCVQSAGC